MNSIKQVFTVLLLLCCVHSNAQGNYSTGETLKQQLERITSAYNAVIGVAVIHIESGDSVAIRNQYHYPMQSVYKFPLALAVMQQVDNKKFKLEQKIHITKEDLKPHTWSPLREKHPEGNVDLTVAELLDYTVSKSDNNGCDILFKLMNGPEEVEKFMHAMGHVNIAIKTTEAEMAVEPDSIEVSNWCYPYEMSSILTAFQKGKYLSPSSRQFLLKLMTESSNSANRIKALLPETTIVAHKTGTGNNVVNDAGIITLPDGKHIALTVFVADSKEPFETSEKIIALLSKAVYDFYIKK